MGRVLNSVPALLAKLSVGYIMAGIVAFIASVCAGRWRLVCVRGWNGRSVVCSCL